MKRTPLQRKTRLKAKRDSLQRRTRMRHKRISTAERVERDAARRDVFRRSHGFCEASGEDKSPKCHGYAGWDEGHLAHTVSRNLLSRADRWNTKFLLWKCVECHTGWEHNGKKPCPPKAVTA